MRYRINTLLPASKLNFYLTLMPLLKGNFVNIDEASLHITC